MDWSDIVNPFAALGNAAASVVADGWTAAMLAIWNAGLWLLRIALTIEDSFLIPDLRADGPDGGDLPGDVLDRRGPGPGHAHGPAGRGRVAPRRAEPGPRPARRRPVRSGVGRVGGLRRGRAGRRRRADARPDELAAGRGRDVRMAALDGVLHRRHHPGHRGHRARRDGVLPGLRRGRAPAGHARPRRGADGAGGDQPDRRRGPGLRRRPRLVLEGLPLVPRRRVHPGGDDADARAGGTGQLRRRVRVDRLDRGRRRHGRARQWP